MGIDIGKKWYTEMNRKQKLSLNTISSLLKQVVGTICGFILPRLFLSHYGSSVNGLVSSISQFLSFASIFDAGMGVVIEASLYKPLAEKDQLNINRVLTSGQRFYYRIATIYAIYVIGLIFAYPAVIESEYDYFFVVTLIIAISLSSFGQYCFGVVNSVFLAADQRTYVNSVAYIVTIVLNTLLGAILINLNCSVQIVKLVASLTFLLRPIILKAYVKSKYNINWKEPYTEEPIKQKWNGFAQHIASLILQNTDVVILSVFSTLENVSIYSIYYLVVHSIQEVINSATVGIRPLLGDMLARKEMKHLDRVFSEVEAIMHAGTTFIFGMTMILLVPFVKVYTAGVTDANYDVPIFSFLLCFAYYINCSRYPYQAVIMAAGHFKQTQSSAIIEAVINIVITIICVFKFGLIGVVCGTVIAMTYRTIYFVVYLKKNILHRPIAKFIRVELIDAISLSVMIGTTTFLNLDGISYFAWIKMAVIAGLICILECVVIQLIFNRDIVRNAINKLIKRNK